MAQTMGENGAYQETEKLAKKVFANGPSYTLGGASHIRLPDCSPTQTHAAMQKDRCPECDSGSMRMYQDGRRVCSRCQHEWRKRA